MKIIYLLPPSEGKNKISLNLSSVSGEDEKQTLPNLPLVRGGEAQASPQPSPFKGEGEAAVVALIDKGGLEEVQNQESLSFPFQKPCEIAMNATEKDLKCTGKRYEEGMELNRDLCESPSPKNSLTGGGQEDCPAIHRYSGVMYNAIDYAGMNADGKQYFEDNFLILSGMYGILRPTDMIGNYKLPIETKGLYQYWGTQITDTLNGMDIDVIVDFLPGSYAKMIGWKELNAKVVRVNFYKNDSESSSEGQGSGAEGQNGSSKGEQKLKKMTHGVKKVKGEYVKGVCENGGMNIGNIEFVDGIGVLDLVL